MLFTKTRSELLVEEKRLRRKSSFMKRMATYSENPKSTAWRLSRAAEAEKKRGKVIDRLKKKGWRN